MASTAYPIEPLTVRQWIDLAVREGWTRVELEDGKVVELSPIHGLHMYTVSNLFASLLAWFGPGRCHPGGTVELDRHTGFDPDLLVLRPDAGVADDEPVAADECLLVVEVAVSSVARDLGTKVVRYGRAGIPEYWVIRPEPEHGFLLRHTQPTSDGYNQVDRFEVGHRAEHIDVAAILGP